MKINLITLGTIKTQLGLSVTTHDAALTALIPIVSSDVRRILNNNFTKYKLSSFTSGSNQLVVYDSYGTIVPFQQSENVLPIGRVIQGTGIPDDCYVTGFSQETATYTISASATTTGSYIYPTISIAQWPTISKMIWYKYKTQKTSDASARGVSSESYGGVSVSYTNSEINKRYNYPQQLIDDLGVPHARIS